MSSSTYFSDQQARRFSAATEALVKAFLLLVFAAYAYQVSQSMHLQSQLDQQRCQHSIIQHFQENNNNQHSIHHLLFIVVKVEQSLEEMKAIKATASSIDSKIGAVESSTNSMNSQMISVESNTASILDRVSNVEKETKELNAGLSRLSTDISGLLRLQRVNHVIDRLEQGKFALTVWFDDASSNDSNVYYRSRKSNPSSVTNRGSLTLYLTVLLTHFTTGIEWYIGGHSFESEDSSDDEDTIMKKEKAFMDSCLRFIRQATGIEPKLRHEDDKYLLSLKDV